MALPKNRLVPLLAFVAVAIVGVIMAKQFTADGPVAAGEELTTAPVAASAPAGKSADADSPEETLRTLSSRLAAVLEDNHKLRAEQQGFRQEVENNLAALRSDQKTDPKDAKAAAARSAAANLPAPSPAGVQPLDLPPSQGEHVGTTGVIDRAGKALSGAVDNAASVIDGLRGQDPRTAPAAGRGSPQRGQPAGNGIPAGLGFDGNGSTLPSVAGAANPAPTYRVIAPLGWADSKDGAAKPLTRTALGSAPVGSRQADFAGSDVGASKSNQLGRDAAAEEAPTPYFTIPENATLTRVTAMTALIGRVPVDGKVTDPMQFKAIIGRENLAANGLDIPDDISGIVVSGIAVGDMALSCNEGKIHSITFVFDDGTIRTVSNRDSRATAGATGQQRPLGYVSDLWGNPCVPGKFVTNAPAYLTDVVGMRTLGIAASAYAAAQTSTTDNGLTGSTTTSVTGDRGAYVLGQAAAGATDQVSQWLTQRLKNSFDAVVSPAGQKLVIHIDQEVAIDRAKAGRRLDHQRSARASRVATSSGEHHGLD